MIFQESQFQYQPDTRAYVAEASDLRIGTPGQRIQLVSERAGVTHEFVFTHADRDSTGEDIYGWNFKPTAATVSQCPSLAYHHVLIIND